MGYIFTTTTIANDTDKKPEGSLYYEPEKESIWFDSEPKITFTEDPNDDEYYHISELASIHKTKLD